MARTIDIAPGGLSATLDRGPLVQALATLSKVVETKNLLPIYAHLLVRAEDGALVLTATNGDLQATARIPAEVAHAGATTIPAKELDTFAAGLPASAYIRIDVDPLRRATTVRSGRSRYTLPGFDPETFHLFEEAAAFTHRFELQAQTLAGALARSAFAISTEETRYYLNGAFFHVVDVDGTATLRMVTTDGLRLARMDLDAAAGLDVGMPGAIVPRRTCEVIKLLAGTAGEGNVTIEFAAALARISAGDIVLNSKLIDGQFPDYARVIPTSHDRRALSPAAPLIAAVMRVANLSLDKVRIVTLTFETGRLGLDCVNVDGGSASDEIEVEYDGPPQDIRFSAEWLRQTVSATGGEVVTIEFAPDDNRVIFQHREGGSALYVLASVKK